MKDIFASAAETYANSIIEITTKCDEIEDYFRSMVDGFTSDPRENRSIVKLALDNGEIPEGGDESKLYEGWERLAADSARLADTLNDWLD